MIRRTSLAAAAVAVLSVISPLRAEQPTTRPVYMQEAATTTPAAEDRPLMALLTSAGIGKTLKDNNINVYGHLETSYIYNFAGANKNIFGNIFEPRSNQFLGNQLNLTVERTVNVTKDKWDIGGRAEIIYGTDSQYIHSNGLNWYTGTDEPQYQFDLNQLYFDLAIPVGNGLRVRGGKIVTLLGTETISPTTNALFTHSYLFNYAAPITHTGIMATYQLDDNWLVEGGIFRGWDQSIDDNNGSISYHLKLGYTSTDKKLGAIGQFVTGPEQNDDTGDFTTVFDFQLTYAFTDKFSLGANSDIGYASNAAPDGDTAWWYGIAGYAAYKLNDTFTLNGRGEWFRDDEGVRIGVAANYFEVTAGIAITPFPNDKTLKNLIIRPELRGDFSTEPVYNNSSDNEMYTAAIDMIFKF